MFQVSWARSFGRVGPVGSPRVLSSQLGWKLWDPVTAWHMPQQHNHALKEISWHRTPFKHTRCVHRGAHRQEHRCRWAHANHTRSHAQCGQYGPNPSRAIRCLQVMAAHHTQGVADKPDEGQQCWPGNRTCQFARVVARAKLARGTLGTCNVRQVGLIQPSTYAVRKRIHTFGTGAANQACVTTRARSLRLEGNLTRSAACVLYHFSPCALSCCRGRCLCVALIMVAIGLARLLNAGATFVALFNVCRGILGLYFKQDACLTYLLTTR